MGRTQFSTSYYARSRVPVRSLGDRTSSVRQRRSPRSATTSARCEYEQWTPSEQVLRQPTACPVERFPPCGSQMPSPRLNHWDHTLNAPPMLDSLSWIQELVNSPPRVAVRWEGERAAYSCTERLRSASCSIGSNSNPG